MLYYAKIFQVFFKMHIFTSYLSILLFLNIGTLLTYSLSKNEYLIENHQELIPEDEEVHFRSLRKRESEPQPVIVKKPIDEKKDTLKLLAKEKDSLKENGTESISTTTTKPSELTPKISKPQTSEVSTTTTELPDLPTDLPKGYNVQEDEGNTTQHFIYYNATCYNETAAKSLWVDLESLPLEKVTKHVMLSSSHRRASTVSLPFDFPFYGHKIRNITIATGGFLYTGDYMHTWLAATQYIAPLMANFDTSIHNESTIKYADCGDNFTVQWEKVFLQDKTQGPFTFQVTLHKSGDISFVYQTVPISIKEINDDHHPVKVGLSDAYIIEKTVVFIRRKTIYEYHRADVSHFDIQNYTSIYFTALPTCQNYSDCDSCMGADNRFECLWCDTIGRCSSGLDRHRQDWINGKCEDLKPADVKCKAPTPAPAFEPTKPTKKPSPTTSSVVPPATSTNTTSNATSSSESTVVVTTYATASAPPKLVTLRPDKKGQYIPAARISDEDEHDDSVRKSSVGAGAVIAILMIICSVLGFAIWIGYAYKYPQSPSGQLLIRYRPSQWRWRHGEARYTAASIHI